MTYNYANIYRRTLRPLDMTLQELSEVTRINRPRLAEYIIHGNRFAVTFEEMETVDVAISILNDIPIKYPRCINRGERKSIDMIKAQRLWLATIEEMIDEKKEERKLEFAAEEIMKILCGPSEKETDYYGLYDAVTYGGLENYGINEFERKVREKIGIM